LLFYNTVVLACEADAAAEREASTPAPHGFEGTVTFVLEDDPAVIAERVWETMEE